MEPMGHLKLLHKVALSEQKVNKVGIKEALDERVILVMATIPVISMAKTSRTRNPTKSLLFLCIMIFKGVTCRLIRS
jgi:hypothetical protein